MNAATLQLLTPSRDTGSGRYLLVSVALIAVAACKVPNPAFDPARTGGGPVAGQTGSGEAGSADSSGQGTGPSTPHDAADGDLGEGDGDLGDGDGDLGDGDGDLGDGDGDLGDGDGDLGDSDGDLGDGDLEGERVMFQSTLDDWDAIVRPLAGDGQHSETGNTSFVSDTTGSGIAIMGDRAYLRVLRHAGGTANYPLDRGAIEFLYQPGGGWDKSAPHQLFSLGKMDDDGIRCRWRGHPDHDIDCAIEAEGKLHFTEAHVDSDDWQADRPVSLRVEWDTQVEFGERNMRIYVNDAEVSGYGDAAGTGPLNIIADTGPNGNGYFYLGAWSRFEVDSADGVFHDLIIWSQPRP